MPNTQQMIHSALLNLPRFAELPPDSYSTIRLGGLTNLVHHIQIGDEHLIVRIPGEGTSEFIDREVELHNARVAAKAGVSADVLWADPITGVMISRFVENTCTMSPSLFKSRPGSVTRAAKAFGQLHRSGATFQFRFELFSMIEDYLKILSTKDIDLPKGYAGVVTAAQPVKQLLADKPLALAPCHCDPLCENFLDGDTRMWIVDWEYSGMNDPMWDLGDLSVEAEFNASQDAELLRAYFEREPTPAEVARMVIYKAMCDLLWTLWGLIQYANGAEGEDFHAYAQTRFSRCQTLMNDPAFRDHLSAVAQSG